MQHDIKHIDGRVELDYCSGSIMVRKKGKPINIFIPIDSTIVRQHLQKHETVTIDILLKLAKLFTNQNMNIDMVCQLKTPTYTKYRSMNIEYTYNKITLRCNNNAFSFNYVEHDHKQAFDKFYDYLYYDFILKCRIRRKTEIELEQLHKYKQLMIDAVTSNPNITAADFIGLLNK